VAQVSALRAQLDDAVTVQREYELRIEATEKERDHYRAQLDKQTAHAQHLEQRVDECTAAHAQQQETLRAKADALERDVVDKSVRGVLTSALTSILTVVCQAAMALLQARLHAEEAAARTAQYEAGELQLTLEATRDEAEQSEQQVRGGLECHSMTVKAYRHGIRT
jgi:hypothetical protein